MNIEDNYIRKIKEIEKVTDGDTITAIVELGYNQLGRVTFRFDGINTAEMKSKVGTERYELAHKAKDYVTNIMSNYEVCVQSYKFADGGFGRYLGVMYYLNDNEWINLNDELLNNGLAQKYYLGASKDYGEFITETK